MRPRERYAHRGPTSFGDIELLGLVVGTGTSTRSSAEVAAALPEWRGAVAAEGRPALTSGERLTAAVGLLTFLWRRTERGERVEQEDIDGALPADTADLGNVLGRLTRLGYVAIAEDGRLVLARDLDEISVYALQRDLGLGLVETPAFRQALTDEAPDLAAPDLARMMTAAEAAKADIMSISVKALACRPAVQNGDATSQPPDVRAAGD